jgi:hypothetical protein
VADELGFSALAMASRTYSVMVLALQRDGANINFSGKGSTPLLVAAQRCHHAAVEALVKARAAVDQATADG